MAVFCHGVIALWSWHGLQWGSSRVMMTHTTVEGVPERDGVVSLFFVRAAWPSRDGKPSTRHSTSGGCAMTRHLSGGWAIVNEKASMHAGAWRVGRRSSRRAALGV